MRRLKKGGCQKKKGYGRDLRVSCPIFFIFGNKMMKAGFWSFVTSQKKRVLLVGEIKKKCESVLTHPFFLKVTFFVVGRNAVKSKREKREKSI